MRYVIFLGRETHSRGYECVPVEGISFKSYECAEKVCDFFNEVSYSEWLHGSGTDRKKCDIYSVHRESDVKLLERVAG